jgi:hypothetical protein
VAAAITDVEISISTRFRAIAARQQILLPPVQPHGFQSMNAPAAQGVP